MGWIFDSYVDPDIATVSGHDRQLARDMGQFGYLECQSVD
jgi:hypothetical protein